MSRDITVREIGRRFVYNGNLYATYQVNGLSWVVINYETKDIVKDENIVSLAHEGLML